VEELDEELEEKKNK